MAVGVMPLHIELSTEEDGRAIAEVTELPGVLCYGSSPQEAIRDAKALALEVIAARLRHDEKEAATFDGIFFAEPRRV